MEKTMDKAIITVVGKDTVGIIAKVCTYLADNGVNVLDISQTIVSGFFNMMMIVDMADAKKHFAEISGEMDALGEKIGVSIKCQREEIFEKCIVSKTWRKQRMINSWEVQETNEMIEKENLDVRTITLGISLLDCIDSDLDRLNQNIYNKITTVAKDLVATGEKIEKVIPFQS